MKERQQAKARPSVGLPTEDEAPSIAKPEVKEVLAEVERVTQKEGKPVWTCQTCHSKFYSLNKKRGSFWPCGGSDNEVVMRIEEI